MDSGSHDSADVSMSDFPIDEVGAHLSSLSCSSESLKHGANMAGEGSSGWYLSFSPAAAATSVVPV